MSGLPPRRRSSSGGTFRPKFTLTLLYAGAFFILFALLLVMPELWPLFHSTLPDAELEALAQETAQAAARGRIGVAFVLAVVATLAGSWFRVLPGLRRP